MSERVYQQVQSYRKTGLYLAVMHLERFPVILSPKLHLLIIYKKTSFCCE
jgi:hypothetical protein